MYPLVLLAKDSWLLPDLRAFSLHPKYCYLIPGPSLYGLSDPTTLFTLLTLLSSQLAPIFTQSTGNEMEI